MIRAGVARPHLYFVASAGVTPISAPHLCTCGSLRSGYHLHSVHHAPYSYPLRSAITFAPFTFHLASSFHQSHPRHYPTGLAGVLFGSLLLSTSCSHSCLLVVGSPHPLSSDSCPQACFQLHRLIIWGIFRIFDVLLSPYLIVLNLVLTIMSGWAGLPAHIMSLSPQLD